MKITYKHPETKKELALETDKKLIMVYGKNGSEKTTLSGQKDFKDELRFNEDFVNKNIYTISEKWCYSNIE